MLRQLNLDGACLYHWELMNVTMPTMVGEWSLAITDCQLYLQGGVNDPYHPGTGAEVSFKVFLSFSYSPRCARGIPLILPTSLKTTRISWPSSCLRRWTPLSLVTRWRDIDIGVSPHPLNWHFIPVRALAGSSGPPRRRRTAHQSGISSSFLSRASRLRTCVRGIIIAALTRDLGGWRLI